MRQYIVEEDKFARGYVLLILKTGFFEKTRFFCRGYIQKRKVVFAPLNLFLQLEDHARIKHSESKGFCQKQSDSLPVVGVITN